MPAAGGQSREVYSSSPWQDSSNVNGLSWTADGKSLLFVKPQNGETVLWRVPVAGGRPEPTGIARKGQIKSPQMSPDRKQMYFGASEPAPGELWTLENFLPKREGR
jgi:Tol biopolymer transport system component